MWDFTDHHCAEHLHTSLQKLHVESKKRDKKNARMKLMRGDVPERLLEKAKELKESFDKLSPQATL